MRTTLDIEDSVLAAAKEIARARGQTTGMVISELASRGLASKRPSRQQLMRFPVFEVPANADVLTVQCVAAIVDDEADDEGLPARR